MSDNATMGGHWLAMAAAALAFTAAGEAAAQLYKCKGPDGKTVYSDRRCESTDTSANLPAGVGNRAHAIEEKAAADKAAAQKAAEEARLQAEALLAAQAKALAAARAAGAPGAAPSASGAPSEAGTPAAVQSGSMPAPYQLSGSDMERVRSLEMTAGSVGASAEQKAAARLEISSIKYGRDSRFSASERQRRDSLNIDLSSTDAAKRKRALSELRSIYSQ